MRTITMLLAAIGIATAVTLSTSGEATAEHNPPPFPNGVLSGNQISVPITINTDHFIDGGVSVLSPEATVSDIYGNG